MGSLSNTGIERVSGNNEHFLRNGYQRVPTLVQWMATLRCDLSCSHCLAVSQDSGFSDMPLPTVRRLIDEIAEMGVPEFLVTGGEPLTREDLPAITDYLGHMGQNWTLNTAAMPSANQRKALAENSPGFVAVSLDGPRQIHDSFRGKNGAWKEAMEAIRYFRTLPGVRVCAGTTVTSLNYHYLEETFHLVTSSGVDQWGIHLLVPEGRAAFRTDIFLSKHQLRNLVEFVARKRNYFNVEMADEIGYLGSYEPLVRAFPLSCGAGKSQCVVLPDGEVVPCTTLDRSFSAGNINLKPLRDIWGTGFRELREYAPEGKCSKCIYYPACGSGCWLQRKNGRECFKEVWQIPSLMKTAAGLTVCLGALASGMSRGEEIQFPDTSSSHSRTEQTSGVFQNTEGIILDTYSELLTGNHPGELYSSFDEYNTDDPAWEVLKLFRKNSIPEESAERCELVLRASETGYPSLSLAALLWRVVNEPLFQGEVFTEGEMEALYRAIAVIREKSTEWRQAIFENRLDPYLADGRLIERPFFMYSKAGPRQGEMERYFLSNDLDSERWETSADTTEITSQYLQEHPFAGQMHLTFRSSFDVKILNNFSIEPLSRDSNGCLCVGIFDVIESSENAVFLFEISGVPGSGEPLGFESGDFGEDEEIAVLCVVEVSVSAGRKYAYVELLREAYHQNRDVIMQTAIHFLEVEYGHGMYMYNDDLNPGEITENGSLLWPAIREMAYSDVDIPWLPQTTIGIGELRRRAKIKDIDFWMF